MNEYVWYDDVDGEILVSQYEWDDYTKSEKSAFTQAGISFIGEL